MNNESIEYLDNIHPVDYEKRDVEVAKLERIIKEEWKQEKR